MAFVPRIYLAGASSGTHTVIDESDVNHIKNVLRIPVGGEITVCDGRGTSYSGKIVEFSPFGIVAELGKGKHDESEFPFSVTVYQCYPKGEKAETVVQKAVELGATEIVFVMSERCVARPDEKSMQKKLARLQKIADSAASQCGRGILPQVKGLVPYEKACEQAANSDCAFLCYEGDGTLPLRGILELSPHAKSYAFLIGPEGGISPEEVNTAVDAGLALAGLGHRILRTETAALFVLSAMNVLC